MHKKLVTTYKENFNNSPLMNAVMETYESQGMCTWTSIHSHSQIAYKEEPQNQDKIFYILWEN